MWKGEEGWEGADLMVFHGDGTGTPLENEWATEIYAKMVCLMTEILNEVGFRLYQMERELGKEKYEVLDKKFIKARTHIVKQLEGSGHLGAAELIKYRSGFTDKMTLRLQYERVVQQIENGKL